MSDTNATAPQNAPQNIPLRFMGQFIRDLSFEVPHAPSIYVDMRSQAPNIPVSFECRVEHVQGSVFDVTLAVDIHAKIGEKPAFLLELAYGTIVEVDETIVPADQLHPFLHIEIPRFLFPFVRQIISETSMNGGFPPLNLQPIEFHELYARRFGGQQQPIAIVRNPNAPATA